MSEAPAVIWLDTDTKKQSSSTHLTKWIQQNRTRTTRPTGFANKTQKPKTCLSNTADSTLIAKPDDLLDCYSTLWTSKVVTSSYPVLLLSNDANKKRALSYLAGSKLVCTTLHVVYTDLDLDIVNTSRDSLSIASSTSLLITSSSIPQFSPSAHSTQLRIDWLITAQLHEIDKLFFDFEGVIKTLFVQWRYKYSFYYLFVVSGILLIQESTCFCIYTSRLQWWPVVWKIPREVQLKRWQGCTLNFYTKKLKLPLVVSLRGILLYHWNGVLEGKDRKMLISEGVYVAIKEQSGYKSFSSASFPRNSVL